MILHAHQILVPIILLLLPSQYFSRKFASSKTNGFHPAIFDTASPEDDSLKPYRYYSDYRLTAFQKRMVS
ncbi:MAG: hypothetical protein WCL14_13880 [Bacteroidota bacterium]